LWPKNGLPSDEEFSVADYDLAVLNDKDFEKLVVDLLSAELQVPVERFKAGKDGGVDGRWFSSPGNEVIVQCKHWPRSSIATILRHITKEEKAKVDALAPARYIFVCSIPLSRKNKQAIAAAFSPHIKSEADVLGFENLQALISQHKEVERRHYKLWLSSSHVLASLLNNGVLGRSDDAIPEIKAALLKYVETDDSRKAKERLEKARVVIIKGEPGVGKTTLAQNLVMQSVADGYQLIVLERDIGEAEAPFDVESKQVFYFDDFLGRNFLEALSENKDSHIVNFTKRVLRNDAKRFVLTSRTHILDRGKQLSELFGNENIGRREFELTVGGLSRMERAKILYAHVWSSGLPPWAIEQIYLDNRYLKVVDHPNYNPRIIAFITDPERLVDVPPEGFWGYVEDTLDNPEAIWRHVFERQLGSDTRDVAILVGFNGKPIDQPVLEKAFRRLNQLSSDNPVQLGHRFMDALKLGVGSVLNRTIEAGQATRCSLFNPSIVDYLLRDEVVSSRIVDVIRSLQTVDALNYIASLVEENYFAREVFRGALEGMASDLRNEGVAGGPVSIRLCELLIGEGMLEAGGNYCALVANEIVPEDLGMDKGRLRVFTEILCRGELVDEKAKLEQIMDTFDRFATDEEQMIFLRQCAECVDARSGTSIAPRLRDEMVKTWQEYVHDVVVDARILEDYYDLNDAAEARATVRQHISDTFERIGFPLTDGELDGFVFAVEYEDIINDNINSASDDWRDSDEASHGDDGDAEIVDYFDRSGLEPVE